MSTPVEFQEHTVQEIADGDSRILVAPDFGARLLKWDVAGRPIIHWPDDADWGNVAGVRGGNPILFPFVARHMVDGVIGKWQDAQGTVRELPMHGFARDLPFSIIEDGDQSTLRMRLSDSRSTLRCYPFSFQFDVVYRLQSSTLEVRLETTNTGDTALPYYAGHHFYFAVPHQQRKDWTLSIPSGRYGGQNPDGSVWFKPAERSIYTLDEADIIDRMHLEPARQVGLEYSGGRSIVIDLGNARGKNEVPWYCVTTWTQQPDSDFFCIEPWLGMPNAIHHGHGLRWLQPGDCEIAICSLTVK